MANFRITVVFRAGGGVTKTIEAPSFKAREAVAPHPLHHDWREW